MALIYGQIGSLKTLREKLNSKGIYRFNSIAEINLFLDNYNTEKGEIFTRFKDELDHEISTLKDIINDDENLLSNTLNINKQALEIKIKQIKNKVEIQKYNDSTLFIYRIYTKIFLNYLGRRIKYIEKNRDYIIKDSTSKIEKSINHHKKILKNLSDNKESIIRKRSSNELYQVDYTKDVILELNPFIAGAIGENLVSNEIKKLSDDHILINDFSLNFEKPIYNKSENDRIYSIQIDHLLITKAGIFILETKNWSKKSLESLDLRSPVKQIKRFSYALYSLLHSKNSKYKIRLDKHHWGSKKISVKNIIVMINNKPSDQFNMVKITSLNELNDYVRYFEPVFNDKEFKKVVDSLIRMNDKGTLSMN